MPDLEAQERARVLKEVQQNLEKCLALAKAEGFDGVTQAIEHAIAEATARQRDAASEKPSASAKLPESRAEQ